MWWSWNSNLSDSKNKLGIKDSRQRQTLKVTGCLKPGKWAWCGVSLISPPLRILGDTVLLSGKLSFLTWWQKTRWCITWHYFAHWAQEASISGIAYVIKSTNGEIFQFNSNLTGKHDAHKAHCRDAHRPSAPQLRERLTPPTCPRKAKLEGSCSWEGCFLVVSSGSARNGDVAESTAVCSERMPCLEF